MECIRQLIEHHPELRQYHAAPAKMAEGTAVLDLLYVQLKNL